MPGPKTLQTPRLWLRLLSPGALMAYHRAAATLVADPQDRADMLTFPAPFTVRQALMRIHLAQEWWQADRGWSFGVWHQSHLIGQVQIVVHGKRQRVAEVAYWLSKDARGQGYATEIVEALIQAAQTHWPLEQVEATVVPGNEASARVLRRLGFIAQGQEDVAYDLPHQLPFGLHRVYRRRSTASLLIFARSLADPIT